MLVTGKILCSRMALSAFCTALNLQRWLSGCPYKCLLAGSLSVACYIVMGNCAGWTAPMYPPMELLTTILPDFCLSMGGKAACKLWTTLM